MLILLQHIAQRGGRIPKGHLDTFIWDIFVLRHNRIDTTIYGSTYGTPAHIQILFGIKKN